MKNLAERMWWMVLELAVAVSVLDFLYGRMLQNLSAIRHIFQRIVPR